MSLRLGDLVPNFVAETTEGKIDFHEYLGDGWGVLFSHPADYTLVCTTELGAVTKKGYKNQTLFSDYATTKYLKSRNP